jgi:hypothetical protein
MEGYDRTARRRGRAYALGQRVKKRKGLSSGRNTSARRRAFRDRRRRPQRMKGAIPLLIRRRNQQQ